MRVLAPLIALASVGAVFASVATWPADRMIAAYATPLGGRTVAQRHNAELALHRLIGATIEPGQEFSFNDRVGTYSRDRGYRRAPVSYDGQLVKDWGGGVCQASTTLYNAALLAGMTIVERNSHLFSPSYVEAGRDAAVAYSSVDLRFSNPYSFPVRIEGVVDGNYLRLEIHADHELAVKPRVVSEVREVRTPRTFSINDGNPHHSIRTTGKAGCEVVVTRITGTKIERISRNVYPVMNRVTD
jgi:vancomycin resistance protein YoaR